MKNKRKPLSSKKPPIPDDDHALIEDWIVNRVLPGIKPIVENFDKMIHEEIPDLKYAVKWGNAFYGTEDLGWLIEVAVYDVSVNIVFLNGADLDPKPPLGSDGRTRYFKLRNSEELNDHNLVDYVKRAGQMEGWK